MLAAEEYAGIQGKEFLAALAVAYQVHCRLSDAAPVRARGFEHVTHGAIAAAAGSAKALRLDPARIANALAIAGTANNALRVNRTGELSHLKGLATPNAADAGLQAAFLAMRGVTGPREMFEGVKGWLQVVSGPFEIDWEGENLERVTRTILKKYNMANGVAKYGSETLSVPAVTKNGERISIEFTINLLGRGREGARPRGGGPRRNREVDPGEGPAPAPGVPGGRTNDAVIQLEIGYSTRALFGQVSKEIACRLDGFFRVCPADDQSLADDVIPTIRGPDEVAPERLFPYFIARHGCI